MKQFKFIHLVDLINQSNTLLAVYTFEKFAKKVIKEAALNRVSKWYYLILIRMAVKQREKQIKARNYD